MLAAMQLAIEKKAAGLPGSFQGIVNQTKTIFDTSFRLHAGRDPEMKELIAEAQRLFTEANRTPHLVATTANKRQPGATSRPIDMAAAFEFQKKRGRRKKDAAVNNPTPEITIPVEVSTTPASKIDPELADSLSRMAPAFMRDHFGGIDGLRTFASTALGLQFEDGANYSEMVKAIKAAIKDDSLPE